MSRADNLSWRKVADLLASRLMFNSPCSAHRKPQPDACPFCADSAVLDVYAAKGGQIRLPVVKGERVSIAELSRRADEQEALNG